jgi:NAD(P)-dependent dehydrogenase (short-subunit alcohol dehydrogenase family)
MKKVIVTGHTRGLGAAIAAELKARGLAVLGLARGRSALAGIEQAEVDMADPAALQAWLAGPTLRDFSRAPMRRTSSTMPASSRRWARLPRRRRRVSCRR